MAGVAPENGETVQKRRAKRRTIHSSCNDTSRLEWTSHLFSLCPFVWPYLILSSVSLSRPCYVCLPFAVHCSDSSSFCLFQIYHCVSAWVSFQCIPSIGHNTVSINISACSVVSEALTFVAWSSVAAVLIWLAQTPLQPQSINDAKVHTFASLIDCALRLQLAFITINFWSGPL